MCSGHNGLLDQDLEGWGTARFLQGLSLNQEEERHMRDLSFTGQLHKCAPLNRVRSGACRIRWVPCSAQGLRLAHQCNASITSDLKTKCDHVIKFKIMSPSLQHATPFSRLTSDLFSLSDSIISIIRGLETYQYWQTRVYCLVFAKKFCHNQGSVFTPNCENSIQWNKLCYFHKMLLKKFQVLELREAII